MRITFLGTGTSMGIPLVACSCAVCASSDPRDKRLRTSVMIETGGKNFVIDTGPDFRQQMLREKVKSLDAVIFTHEHKDHLAGLDEVRAFNFICKKKMPVYASSRVQQAIRREFGYIFDNNDYPGIPQIELHTLHADIPFAVEGVEFIPFEVMHYQLPVLGFRVGDFSYITDANFISDEVKEKIRGSKVLVLNALRREEHISHFTLQQAIDLMEELKPERGYFTHMSHQIGFHADVEKELQEFIRLAYDGLVVDI
ncbi:MAG: beta-lactamase superfamily metal-dependent hydrolase [Bacteroidetes bacterium]|nr:MAG: beta-lactamase superfamily metal-dependent hydrolase [Bacteroidota bacterium]